MPVHAGSRGSGRAAGAWPCGSKVVTPVVSVVASLGRGRGCGHAAVPDFAFRRRELVAVRLGHRLVSRRRVCVQLAL